jgi:beta-mannosidase
VAIAQIRQITHLNSPDEAKEHVFVEVDSNVEETILLRARYEPKNFEGEAFSHEETVPVNKGLNQIDFEMDLTCPALWWTHDYGPQNLYKLTVECLTADDAQLLDQASIQTGIKEFRLDRSGKEGGTWKVSLNGHRIFPKGTNYPPWQRLQTGTREGFDRDLQLFKEANMNMLRVHAHLEREEFYDACDEAGILLWQDLPLQWGYNKHKFPEIERQAQVAVRQFQSHPCIGIWCAHNEPFFAPDPVVIKRSSVFFALGLVGVVLASIFAGLVGFGASVAVFFVLLWVAGRLWNLYPWGLFVNTNNRTLDPALYRLIVNEEEGQNAAIPYSGICETPNLTVFRSPRLLPKQFGGWAHFYTDFHYYAGWYNRDWKTGDYRYHITWWGLKGKLRETARFVTEYGAQALPTAENLLQFHPRPEHWPPDPSWWQPLTEDRRFQKGVQDKWVKPENYASLEEYAEESQKWQAEVVKATTEMFRQEKYAPVAGLLTFLGIDCFPAITWAIIDYYRTPKQAYAVVKDAFEPLYAMVDWPERTYAPGAKYQSPIYLSNDYWEPVDTITLAWELENSAGEIIERANLPTHVGADCVSEIGRVEFVLPKEPFVTLKLLWNNPKKDDRVFVNRYRIDIGSSYWARNY